jgi:hypothetical protein
LGFFVNGDPDLPDLNRLFTDCVWDADAQRWERTEVSDPLTRKSVPRLIGRRMLHVVGGVFVGLIGWLTVAITVVFFDGVMDALGTTCHLPKHWVHNIEETVAVIGFILAVPTILAGVIYVWRNKGMSP